MSDDLQKAKADGRGTYENPFNLNKKGTDKEGNNYYVILIMKEH